MSILDSLKNVKKQLIVNEHPLVEESLEFRQTYLLGCALLVCVNGHPSEQEKDRLEKIVQSLKMPSSFLKEVLQQALHTNDETIHTILAQLEKKAVKYIFMLELYCIAQQDHKITDKEQELIVLFEELLQLSYVEIQFIRGFRLAILRKDVDFAVKIVQTAIEQQVRVPLEALGYFFKGFEYEERLMPMTISSGQKKEIHYKTLIKGNVIVGAGAELNLNGMEVRFSNDASIIVDGGVLKANGAKFTATLDANQPMLVVRNSEAFVLRNAKFNGANLVRAVEAAQSNMTFEGCTFERCFDEERGGAIYVGGGEHVQFERCTFEHNSTIGKGGAIYVAGSPAKHMLSKTLLKFTSKNQQKKVAVRFEHCQFKQMIADIGGALYMYHADLSMQEVTFENCKGRIGAAAIDGFECNVLSHQTLFTLCESPAPFAVVELKDTNVKECSEIGQFEQCDERHCRVK